MPTLPQILQTQGSRRHSQVDVREQTSWAVRPCHSVCTFQALARRLDAGLCRRASTNSAGRINSWNSTSPPPPPDSATHLWLFNMAISRFSRSSSSRRQLHAVLQNLSRLSQFDNTERSTLFPASKCLTNPRLKKKSKQKMAPDFSRYFDDFSLSLPSTESSRKKKQCFDYSLILARTSFLVPPGSNPSNATTPDDLNRLTNSFTLLYVLYQQSLSPYQTLRPLTTSLGTLPSSGLFNFDTRRFFQVGYAALPRTSRLGPLPLPARFDVPFASLPVVAAPRL